MCGSRTDWVRPVTEGHSKAICRRVTVLTPLHLCAHKRRVQDFAAEAVLEIVIAALQTGAPPAATGWNDDHLAMLLK